MTAARDEEPGIIPGQSWPDGWGALDLAPTRPAASRQIISLRTTDRQKATVELGARELREIAASMWERADLLDNPAGRNRKTPEWHIREGERLLRAGVNKSNLAEEAAYAQSAQAHFLAAVALRGLTTHPQTVVHVHHTDPSGKDSE